MLFALPLIAKRVDEKYHTGYLDRLKTYHTYCQEKDLSMAVAQTDVKGDRGLMPSEKIHPDYYVRIVEKRADGIDVRGAKAYTTCAPYVDEIIVLPTCNLKAEDADYAVSFAIRANTPGLKMIASSLGSPSSPSDFHHPVSSHHRMIESLTVFDDVFVPNERVYMAGEWEFAGALANTFVQFHRFTAVSYKLPLCNLLTGAAALLADYNGVDCASHVLEKLMQLISYTEMFRALSKAAAVDCTYVDGTALPNSLITNVAKFFLANNYHEMVRCVQDIAGGLVVTGLSQAPKPAITWRNI